MVSILSRALWREIRRRPAQFISVAVVIALGVGLFTASFDAFLNLTGSYEHMYRQTNFAHVTAVGGPAEEVLAGAPPLLQEHFTANFARLPDWEQSQILSSLQRIVALMEAGDVEAGPILTTGPVDATPERTEEFLQSITSDKDREQG